MVAATTSNKPDSHTMDVIIVLGMHRTGTSLCTHILTHLGVTLSADLIESGPDNVKGFFESSHILEIHKRIMKLIGTGAAHSLTICPRPNRWWTLPELAVAKTELCQLVKSESFDRAKTWGFKDPRTTVLLPLWKEVFMAARVRPIYLLTIREPWEVAVSLKKRNGIPESLSELLWLEHYVEAIRHVAKEIAMVIPYARWFRSPLEQTRDIAKAIGYVPTGDADAFFKKISRDTISPGLRHNIDKNNVYKFNITRMFHDWLERGNFSEPEDIIERVEAQLPDIAQQVN